MSTSQDSDIQPAQQIRKETTSSASISTTSSHKNTTRKGNKRTKSGLTCPLGFKPKKPKANDKWEQMLLDHDSSDDFE